MLFSFLFVLFLLITVFYKSKFPLLLGVGLFIRLFLVFLHFVLKYNLPDSGDGFGFLRVMNDFLSYNPIENGLSILSSIWLYPSVVAFISSNTGASVLLIAISLNVWSGMYMLKVLSNFIAKESNKYNGKVALISLLIVPTLSVYSANLLRETYVCLFLILSYISLYNVNRKSKKYNIFKCAFYILCACLFHIGVIIVFLPITIYLYRRKIIGLFPIIITGGLVLFTLIYFKIGLAKIEGIYNFIDGTNDELSFRVQTHDERLKRRSDVYYFNKQIDGLESQILYLIPKSIEFILRPNIIDIEGNYDVFKFLETLFFLYLIMMFYKKCNKNKNEKYSKMVFNSVIALILIYGSYSGDLNQGHRHKLKILPLIVLGLTLTNKNNYAFYLSSSSKSKIQKG